MKHSLKRRSVNQEQKKDRTYTDKIMNGAEQKYQEDRYIAIATMCPNPDKYIDLTDYKCV